MLRGTIAFLVVLAFAVAGSELRDLLARRGLRAPAMEGLSFLLVGFLLGERVLGLFPSDILAALRPVVLLGVAWVGLAFGVQLDVAVLRRLRRWHCVVALVTPTVIGAVVAVAGALMGLQPALAVGLAAVTMVPSGSILDAAARDQRVGDRGALQLLRLMSAFAGVPAVLFLVVASSAAGPDAPAGEAIPAWKLLGATLGVGISFGYALVVLMRGVRDRILLLTLVTGVTAGTAGATAILGVTGLPAGALVGAIGVNRTVFPHLLLRTVQWLERPMLVALLVLVGASWGGVSFAWRVFLLVTLVRLPVVLLAGRLVVRAARRHGLDVQLQGLGWGMAAPGELALGILVALLGTSLPISGVLEAVVAAVVCCHLAAQAWIRTRLVEAAEAGPP